MNACALAAASAGIVGAAATAAGVVHGTHKGCSKTPNPMRDVGELAAVALAATAVVVAVAAVASGKDAALCALAAGAAGIVVGGGLTYAASEFYPFPSHRKNKTAA